MAQSLIACPLCSAASFSSSRALCLSLVSVASKWLRCTLCEEELRGLDKLTLHLLSHLIHTNDFKKLLSGDNATTMSEKLVSTHEPLNLVKNQNEQLSEGIYKKLSSHIYNSCSAQAKTISDIMHERPSLKIDDEVMIFFNHNEDTQHSHSDTTKPTEKPHVIPSSNELPKFIIDFRNNLDKQSENSVTSDSRNTMVSDDYFDLPSTNEAHHFFYAADNSSNHQDNSNTNLVSESQMDFSSQKAKENDKCLVETNKSSDSGAIIPAVYNNLENHTANKSSFLSPKGERVLGYRCDICSLVFPDEHILLMHRKLIHVELNEDPSKTKSYKCHLCSKSFVMKGSLMVHMRVAHFGGAVVARLVETKQLETDAVSPDSAQFICSICNKGFKKEQQLSQHEKLHEGKQCDICLKAFTTKYFLRKHKRLHTGEMPYSCNVCNKSFTFQQSYHKHLLYHSDDKPYTCAECGRAFKELSTLHNHQRIHTGEKPFSCETCGKCFRQRVSYLVHRRIHTGLMPYSCQDCGKTFRYKVSERTHKCPVFMARGNALDNSAIDTCQEIISPILSRESTMFQINTHNNDVEKQVFGEHHTQTKDDQVVNSSYPEPTDFFSLVMSPSERLQHLSLTAKAAEDQGGDDSIDTESLKQLLYDVADYN